MNISREEAQQCLTAFTTRDIRLHEACATMLQSRLAEVEQEPDMFWNADDSEKCYESISEFLNDELCNGNPLEVGDTRKVMQAKRFPTIEIRITAVDDNECEADWEVIAAPQGATK